MNFWASSASVPPLLGAIVGALLGVLGTQLFNKLSRSPKPLIFIDRLKVDRSQRPPDAVARPTEQTRRLMIDLADDPFVSEVIPLAGKVEERAYVDCLERASKEIEEVAHPLSVVHNDRHQSRRCRPCDRSSG